FSATPVGQRQRTRQSVSWNPKAPDQGVLTLTQSSRSLSLCVVSFHSVRTITHRTTRVNLFDTPGEFAPSGDADIFSAYVGLPTWRGTPGAMLDPCRCDLP